MDIMETAAKDNGANDMTVAKDNAMITGTCYTGNQSTQFAITIFQKSQMSETFVIEFQRRNGDAIQFFKFYKSCSAAILSGKSNKVETEEPTSSLGIVLSFETAQDLVNIINDKEPCQCELQDSLSILATAAVSKENIVQLSKCSSLLPALLSLLKSLDTLVLRCTLIVMTELAKISEMNSLATRDVVYQLVSLAASPSNEIHIQMLKALTELARSSKIDGLQLSQLKPLETLGQTSKNEEVTTLLATVCEQLLDLVRSN